MNMTEYQPNSHKFKEEQRQKAAEEKKIEKVAAGNVKLKKKSSLRQFANSFISEDAPTVKSYILGDVLIPAVKKLFYDIITGGADMFLYGGSGGKKRSGLSDKISYRNFYDRRDDRHSRVESRSSSRFDYDDLIFESRGAAEAVLEQMDAMLDRYKVVTVSDMYDIVDMTAPYTSNKYGWTSLGTAEVKRVSDGYIIKLPKALPID